jgi:glutamyl-tRNA reductase
LTELKTIAFTHKRTPLKELNRFYLHEENRKERLAFVKYNCDLSEILYVATCNRIEFIFKTDHDCDKRFLKKFFQNFRQDWSQDDVDFAIEHAEVYEGEEALRHIYRVASSLDSLVIGEREIITQVRKAYDLCKSEGLTGDFLRLVVKGTITTAKQVYTDTRIAINPVSVVSLAERELRNRKLGRNSRIVMIGAGETNTNLSKYLVKHGFTNFVIFNRSIENAKKLVQSLATNQITAEAFSLNDLINYTRGFDVLVVCTSAPDIIVTPEIYNRLLAGEKKTKVIIDLAIPSNIASSVIEENSADLIDISRLKEVADRNLNERQNEFYAAEEIIEENINTFRQLHKTRQLELRMKDVPEKIRQIKDKAVNDIFAADINTLDDHSKEILQKVLDYMEKKCISVPMIMAKEIILEK